jgi:hypothetical protein
LFQAVVVAAADVSVVAAAVVHVVAVARLFQAAVVVAEAATELLFQAAAVAQLPVAFGFRTSGQMKKPTPLVSLCHSRFIIQFTNSTQLRCHTRARSSLTRPNHAPALEKL